MEQVHFIAFTMLIHAGSDHSASPMVRERGLPWDDPDQERAYHAVAGTTASPCVEPLLDPVRGGASAIDTTPEDEPANDPGSLADRSARRQQVTLYNAPRLLVRCAIEARQVGYGIALQTWAPAPAAWAPAWSGLLIPRLSRLQITPEYVASGAVKHTLTWLATPWVGHLRLAAGASLRPDGHPVLQVRSLVAPPPFSCDQEGACTSPPPTSVDDSGRRSAPWTSLAHRA